MYRFILFIGRVWKEYVGGLVTTRSGEELLDWPKSSFGFPYDILKKSKQTFWPAHSMAGSLQMGMECKDICAPCDYSLKGIHCKGGSCQSDETKHVLKMSASLFSQTPQCLLNQPM